MKHIKRTFKPKPQKRRRMTHAEGREALLESLAKTSGKTVEQLKKEWEEMFG